MRQRMCVSRCCCDDVCVWQYPNTAGVEFNIPTPPSSNAEVDSNPLFRFTESTNGLPVGTPFRGNTRVNVTGPGNLEFGFPQDFTESLRGVIFSFPFDERFDDRFEISIRILSASEFFTIPLGDVFITLDFITGERVLRTAENPLVSQQYDTWNFGDTISLVRERISCDEFREFYLKNGSPLANPLNLPFPGQERILNVGIVRGELSPVVPASIASQGQLFTPTFEAQLAVASTIVAEVDWQVELHNKVDVGPIVWSGLRGDITGLTQGNWYEFVFESDATEGVVTDCNSGVPISESSDGIRFIFQATGPTHQVRIEEAPGFDLSQITFGNVNCIFDNSCENIGIWRLSGAATVDEGANAAYTVSLTGELSAGMDASIDLSITDIDTTPADYASLTAAVNASIAAYTGTGTLTFDGTTLTFTSAGDEMDDLIISLATVDDTDDEADEDFTVEIANPDSTTGARISGTGSVTTTIIDNDDAPAGNDVEVTFPLGVTTTVALDAAGNGSASTNITSVCGGIQIDSSTITISDLGGGDYTFDFTGTGPTGTYTASTTSLSADGFTVQITRTGNQSPSCTNQPVTVTPV